MEARGLILENLAKAAQELAQKVDQNNTDWFNAEELLSFLQNQKVQDL